MGSKGRIPPPHLRRPLPVPGIVHPDPFGSRMHTTPDAFSPFDMLPHPEIMEQKLAAQHVEMQRLATENQRLAGTHGTLRQELAAAQHELQILHAQIGAVKSEREQQMRNLMDKIAWMEAELQAAEPVKLEMQQAQADAQNLNVARHELISKAQQLAQDLQKAHTDVQQIPGLVSELEGLRQEYHHCRVTYDYEKKLYSDHLESLQVMGKNYITMAREVEKLRAELTNAANVDRTGGPYSSTTGNYENEPSSGHPVGQNDSIPQGLDLFPVVSGGAAATPAYVRAQSGTAPARAGYEASRGPGYDPPRGPGYDASRGLVYDIQRGTSYDAQRVPDYNTQQGPSYDKQEGTRYDAQRGPVYDKQRGPGYDASSKGGSGSHGQVAAARNVRYGSATPPAARAGSGYEAPMQGGNTVRR